MHVNLKKAVDGADDTSTVLLPRRKRTIRVIRTPAVEKIETSTSFGEEEAAPGAARHGRSARADYDGGF